MSVDSSGQARPMAASVVFFKEGDSFFLKKASTSNLKDGTSVELLTDVSLRTIYTSDCERGHVASVFPNCSIKANIGNHHGRKCHIGGQKVPLWVLVGEPHGEKGSSSKCQVWRRDIWKFLVF